MSTRQHADPIEVVCSALAILSQNPRRAEYFAYDREWLERRRALWRGHSWRIGLIGITSSGKSTLVNALMGRPLLPTRVRPSSNVLVICRGGDKLKSGVHFEDDRKEVYYASRIRSKMAALTDEARNPGNDKQVKEIELYSPDFKLGRGVVLVDTPGLDAADLARHEAVTMELLLPSVDAVIFLNTTKANADGRVLEYLDAIGQHCKPVVFVQNMRDAVEPKLGRGGAVVRTQGQVLQEHEHRQRRLLARSQHAAVRDAPIFQVSAQRAVQGDYESSGLADLVNGLGAILGGLAPQLSTGRLRQLREHFEPLLSHVALSIDREGQFERELQVLRLRAAENAQAYRILQRDLKEVNSSAEIGASTLLVASRALTRSDVSGAEELIGDAETWRAESPKVMRAVVVNYQERARTLASNLNLREQDLRVAAPRRDASTQLSDTIVVKHKRVTRPQRGWFNAFLRVLGLGGTRDEIVAKREVDVPRLQDELEAVIGCELAWIRDVTARIEESVAPIRRGLRLEISRRRRDAITKQELRLHAAEVGAAAHEIRALCAELPVLAEPVAPSQAPQVRATASCDSQDATRSRMHAPALLELRNRILYRCGALDGRASRRILIWGGDGLSVHNFVQRFWSDVVPGSIEPRRSFLCVQPTGTLEAVAVALETDCASGRPVDLGNKIKAFLARPATLFLMVDAEQPGSSVSQLMRSEVWSHVARAYALVLVVQRVLALENAGTLAEGVRALQTIARRIPRPATWVMANDDRCFVGEMVAELFYNGRFLKTLRDEKNWLQRFSDAGQPPSAVVARTLRNWRELSELT